MKGDLPPGGKKESYKMQSIKIKKQDKRLIGIISLYHGYSKDNNIYITSMCIKNDYKKKGFGQEVIEQLINELKMLGYKEIRVNVSLKNWPALRFWINQGFNSVNGVHGDKIYSEKTFASLELTRIL